MPLLVQICIAVATVAFAAIAVVLIRTLVQVRSTARQVEHTMARLDTTLPRLDHAIDEAQGVLATFGQMSQRVDHLVEQFESVGSRAARVSGQLVDEVLVPAGRVAAIARGVRIGVTTLMDTFLTRKNREPSRLEGGNHHE